MADEEEAGADGGEGGGEDAFDPQRALVAQSLEVNKLRQHVEVLKRANERIRDQYKQEIRSLLQPLIERHRKLQVENGKLLEKIEKLSVAPPGSDEALVEELRKLRHDHGILQKITEGLEADSRLARRLQAELEEAHQRIETLDVRVADLERERRRLESLVAERDQARVELDEALEKAQTEQRDWKEKHDKAQESHKNELRGYQQQLGEAIGRYKGLEKQHQDALFARDLLPILYEELQAEAATYDELTALFNGERGNADAYRPADHDLAAPAPVVADTSFTAYQPSEGATIALAAGSVAAGLASTTQHELDEFGVGTEGTPSAGPTVVDDPAVAAAMVEALVDPLDDLPLDDGPALGAVSHDIPETSLDAGFAAPADGDLQVMADDLGELAPLPQAGGEAAGGATLGDLGFSDDEMAVLQDLTGAAPAVDTSSFATEAMHAGYDLAVESEQLAADDDGMEPVLDEPTETPFAAAGFSFGDTPATVAAEDDLSAYMDALEQGQLAPHDEAPAVLQADVLELDDEPMVLGSTGFDEDMAERAAGVHSGLAHPISDAPGMVFDDAATEDEVAERTLIDRDVWEIEDGGETVMLGDAELQADAGDDTGVDFASQLAQSLGGFADTNEDDVEDVVWEDGPLEEIAEEAHAAGGVMFAPGALGTPAPAFDPEAEDEADLEVHDLESEVEEAHGAPDVGSAWPAGGPEAAEAADEMQPSWGDALGLEGSGGSWAAAMASDTSGMKHSETSISAEDIARLLDDDDDLGMGTMPTADTDSPDFRIQPPKLEPPPLP